MWLVIFSSSEDVELRLILTSALSPITSTRAPELSSVLLEISVVSPPDNTQTGAIVAMAMMSRKVNVRSLKIMLIVAVKPLSEISSECDLTLLAFSSVC